MQRSVYFAFDYHRDLARVKKICAVPGVVARAAGGFETSTVWQQAERQGEAAVRALIDESLGRTEVTALCLGMRTSFDKHLDYQIERSFDLGNGLVAVTINQITDDQGTVDPYAPVPPIVEAKGYRVYPYTSRSHLAHQIEEAYQLAQLDEPDRLARASQPAAPKQSKERRSHDRRPVSDATVRIDGESYPVRNWNARGFLIGFYSGDRRAGDTVDIDFSVEIEEKRLQFRCQAAVIWVDRQKRLVGAMFENVDEASRRLIAAHFAAEQGAS